MNRANNYETNVRQTLEVLDKMLQDYVGAITLDSKIPFKGDSLIEVLLYRVVELGYDALFLHEHRRLMTSFIVTRSIFETAALMQWSVVKMRRFIENDEKAELDDGLVVSLVGSRLEGAQISAKNIVGVLKYLDKHIALVENGIGSYQRIYSWFSEYCHPNTTCTLHRYAQIEDSPPGLRLAKNMHPIPEQLAIHSLHMTLAQALSAHFSFSVWFPEFVAKFSQPMS